MDWYQVVRDGYEPGALIPEGDGISGSGLLAGDGDIETQVKGFLANRIQLRSERKGDVIIVESRWGDGGTCPTCATEYMRFIVKVDGHVVYRSDPEPGLKGLPEGAEEITSIAAFEQWLSGGAA